MSVCDNPYWRCPWWGTHNAVIGSGDKTEIKVTSNRLVTLDLDGTSITMQKRKRRFAYDDEESFSLSGVKAVWEGIFYVTCYDSVDSEFTDTFNDTYDTFDTEIQYLDLRNDIVVTKEYTDEMEAKDDARETTPTNSVSWFTGYESISTHPVVFDTVPIEETIEWKLYSGNAETLLHKQTKHRGSWEAVLIMPSFPTSLYGIRLRTEWAEDYEWYRTDWYEEIDGDSLLFFAPWHRMCGQMDQYLDEFNRDVIATYHTTTDHEGFSKDTGINPGVTTATVFRGSVAFDRDKNRFYSIAVPNDVSLVDPEYIINNKLEVSVDDEIIDVPFPTEQVVNKIMDSSGENQAKDASGELEWTEPEDSEYDIWFPIAPL